jgi:hypothetical protein
MSTSSGGTISIPADGRRVSADIANVLENDNVWEFDILELERITGWYSLFLCTLLEMEKQTLDHHPLSRLGTKIFDRWNINETLNCAPDTINRWLVIVEANYQSGNGRRKSVYQYPQEYQ